LNAALAAGLGVGPPVVWSDAASGALVTKWVEGPRPASPAVLLSQSAMEAACAALRCLHQSGAPFVGQIDLQQEITRYARIAHAHHQLAEAGLSAADVGALVAGATDRLAATAPPLAPCHNDPSPGNWLLARGTALLLDWEYAAMNDPAWDLACLAAEACFPAEADRRLLGAYHPAGVPAGAAARHDVLRCLADVLASLWHLAQAGVRPPGRTATASATASASAARLRRAVGILGADRFAGLLQQLDRA
jgi:aminoglycoside phosphotransferase (APT) family kinase protein